MPGMREIMLEVLQHTEAYLRTMGYSLQASYFGYCNMLVIVTSKKN